MMQSDLWSKTVPSGNNQIPLNRKGGVERSPNAALQVQREAASN